MTATLNPNDHPHPHVLAGYAAGDLADCRMLLVAVHLALCPSCRQHMQDVEAKAGINLEDMPVEKMDTDCLANLLLKIDEHGPPACIDVTIPVHIMPAQASWVPEPLHDFVGHHLDPALWRQAGEGVFHYHAPKPFPGMLRLCRFTAGAAITLKGETMLLILEGEIRTLMHTHGPGDIVKNNWIPSLGRKAYSDLIGLIA